MCLMDSLNHGTYFESEFVSRLLLCVSAYFDIFYNLVSLCGRTFIFQIFCIYPVFMLYGCENA